MTNVNLLVVQEHAVDSLDGALSSLRGLVVDKAVALGATLFIGGNLAG